MGHRQGGKAEGGGGTAAVGVDSQAISYCSPVPGGCCCCCCCSTALNGMLCRHSYVCIKPRPARCCHSCCCCCCVQQLSPEPQALNPNPRLVLHLEIFEMTTLQPEQYNQHAHTKAVMVSGGSCAVQCARVCVRAGAMQTLPKPPAPFALSWCKWACLLQHGIGCEAPPPRRLLWAPRPTPKRCEGCEGCERC